MEHWWNDDKKGKSKYPEEIFVQVPLSPSYITQPLDWILYWANN